MLLGVERTRNAAHESFAHSISGTDLVVGPRTSPVQLMLYAVFRIGEATSNMKWTSYQELAQNPDVAWTIPLSIGDSHHGFPVVGTNAAYFEHYRYGLSQPLHFAAGRRFEDLFDAVLGAEVAERMRYKVGDRITLSHGTGEFGAEHSDKPFTVVGVLARTGTPVDRSIHVSLEAMEAIHLDWQGGMRIPGLSIPAEYRAEVRYRTKRDHRRARRPQGPLARIPAATDDQHLPGRAVAGGAAGRRAERALEHRRCRRKHAARRLRE